MEAGVTKTLPFPSDAKSVTHTEAGRRIAELERQVAELASNYNKLRFPAKTAPDDALMRIARCEARLDALELPKKRGPRKPGRQKGWRKPVTEQVVDAEAPIETENAT